MILTSFMASDAYSSKAFQRFKDNRITIARRLAAQRGINLADPNNIDADGFPKGYGKNNQAVMMPAFYAAYTGRDADGVFFGSFPHHSYSSLDGALWRSYAYGGD